MDVILLERIEKLGAIGDVVKVKNGYARNFLLPRGKALRANESNRKVYEANRDLARARTLHWFPEYALPNVLAFFELPNSPPVRSATVM